MLKVFRKVSTGKKISLVGAWVFCGFLFMESVFASPLNNVFDTQPIYTVLGTDKFYLERDKESFHFNFHLSPFYQQTSTARNSRGKKVPAGDRLGQWNMFGLFFNVDDAAPKVFDANNYPVLYAARGVVANTTQQAETDDNRYRFGKSLATEANFSPELAPFAFVSVPTNYEKVGLRSKISFDFPLGFGFSIKGGLADTKLSLKQTGTGFFSKTGFILEKEFVEDSVDTTVSKKRTDARNIYKALFTSEKVSAISKETEYDLSPFNKTAAEDIHMQIHWRCPCEFEDSEGDVAVTVVPYLAVGVWLPTGEKRNHNKAFSVPTGNDGYYGLTVDGSLAFDFPVIPRKKQTLQICIGGGFAAYNNRDEKEYRFSSSEFQAGMIPWKVSIVRKRPGITWYANASIKSEHFIDGLSLYMDFVYTQHLRDSLTLIEGTSARKAAFEKGKGRETNESSWKNQQINLGFNYNLTKDLALGGALQAHISGVRVYRSTTLLGSVSLMF